MPLRRRMARNVLASSTPPDTSPDLAAAPNIELLRPNFGAAVGRLAAGGAADLNCSLGTAAGEPPPVVADRRAPIRSCGPDGTGRRATIQPEPSRGPDGGRLGAGAQPEPSFRPTLASPRCGPNLIGTWPWGRRAGAMPCSLAAEPPGSPPRGRNRLWPAMPARLLVRAKAGAASVADAYSVADSAIATPSGRHPQIHRRAGRATAMSRESRRRARHSARGVQPHGWPGRRSRAAVPAVTAADPAVAGPGGRRPQPRLQRPGLARRTPRPRRFRPRAGRAAGCRRGGRSARREPAPRQHHQVQDERAEQQVIGDRDGQHRPDLGRCDLRRYQHETERGAGRLAAVATITPISSADRSGDRAAPPDRRPTAQPVRQKTSAYCPTSALPGGARSRHRPAAKPTIRPVSGPSATASAATRTSTRSGTPRLRQAQPVQHS